MAQIPEDERARVVVPYRAKPSQKAELDAVFAEEGKGRTRDDGRPRVTLSKVVEYVVSLGLDLYWVRHDLGAEMDRVAAEQGWDRRKTLAELVRKGLKAEKKR